MQTDGTSKQSNGHHDAEDGTSIQKLQIENATLNEQVQELSRKLSEATAQSNTSDIVSDSNSSVKSALTAIPHTFKLKNFDLDRG